LFFLTQGKQKKHGNNGAIINCSECGKLISDKASACPHCGNPINWYADNEIVNPLSFQKKPETKHIFRFGVTMAVIYVIYLFSKCPDSSSTSSEYYGDSKISAYTSAEIFIKSRLKSPATAKFQPFDESMVSYSGDEYIVTGYVDSQNSFGALIRSHFRATLKKKPKNSVGRMDVVGLIFDGEKIYKPKMSIRTIVRTKYYFYICIPNGHH
jgi:hypothetical protein